MTERQMQDLIIQHRVLLEYQKNRVVNDALKQLLEAIPELKEVIDYINKKELSSVRQTEDKELTRIITKSFGVLETGIVTALVQLSKYEEIFQRTLLNDLATEKTKKIIVSRGVVDTILYDDPLLGENFSSALKHQSEELKDALKVTLLNGIKSGKNVEQMTTDIRRNFNVVQPRLETLIRTNTSNVMNLTNNNTFLDADFVEYVKYSAILDNRTTDICRGRNGKIYTKEKARGMIPAHWNCRSFFIPIVDKDFRLPENYNMWQKLQSKTKSFLQSDDEEVLKINKNKTMTVEQMKRIEK